MSIFVSICRTSCPFGYQTLLATCFQPVCVQCDTAVTGRTLKSICRENRTFCVATRMPVFSRCFHVSYQAHSVPWLGCSFPGQFLPLCKSRKPSPKVGRWLEPSSLRALGVLSLLTNCCLYYSRKRPFLCPDGSWVLGWICRSKFPFFTLVFLVNSCFS